MIAIEHATLVMKDHLIPEAVLLIEDGKICYFGEERKGIPASCDQRIDAEGCFVGPGFIDIHTHSDGEVFFQEDPARVSRHHLRHGTTTVLSALYYNLNKRQYLDAIDILREAMRDPACANLGGLYMEGPYLNPAYGCNREENPWRGPIDSHDYLPIIEQAWDLTRVWALAPERENILEFVRAVKKRKPEAVFAVAHSEATPQQVEALIPYGLRIGTHHTNATGTLNRYPECRGVCVDEAVNYCREIYAELICDSRGIHVDPYMLRLVRRIKGEDRIILISDAYAGSGPTPPGYEDVTDLHFDAAGEIAGSKMTLDMACRHMMKHTGASIVDVFRYASYNPACAVGFFDRGEIAVGKRADLLIVDHRIQMKKVILKGEVQE